MSTDQHPTTDNSRPPFVAVSDRREMTIDDDEWGMSVWFTENLADPEEVRNAITALLVEKFPQLRLDVWRPTIHRVVTDD